MAIHSGGGLWCCGVVVARCAVQVSVIASIHMLMLAATVLGSAPQAVLLAVHTQCTRHAVRNGSVAG